MWEPPCLLLNNIQHFREQQNVCIKYNIESLDAPKTLPNDCVAAVLSLVTHFAFPSYSLFFPTAAALYGLIFIKMKRKKKYRNKYKKNPDPRNIIVWIWIHTIAYICTCTCV